MVWLLLDYEHKISAFLRLMKINLCAAGNYRGTAANYKWHKKVLFVHISTKMFIFHLRLAAGLYRFQNRGRKRGACQVECLSRRHSFWFILLVRTSGGSNPLSPTSHYLNLLMYLLMSELQLNVF